MPMRCCGPCSQRLLLTLKSFTITITTYLKAKLLRWDYYDNAERRDSAKIIGVIESNNSIGCTACMIFPHSEYGCHCSFLFIICFRLRYSSAVADNFNCGTTWRNSHTAAYICTYRIHRTWRSAPMIIVITIFMCAGISPFGLIDRCYGWRLMFSCWRGSGYGGQRYFV